MDTDPLPDLCSLLLNSFATFNPPASGWLSWSVLIIVALLCLCASAFVSGSEIAYFGLTQADIDDLEEEADDSPAAARAFKLISHSERLLATILIANNMVNITMVVMLSFAINQVIVFQSATVSFLIQTVLLTFLLLLCGEIFPKLAAKEHIVSWAKGASKALTVITAILRPISSLMVKSTFIVNRVVTKKHEIISTDELSQALKLSDVKAGRDKEILKGILTFGEKEVRDIMISRVDVTLIEYHASWEEVMHTIRTSGYSRIPVYDTSQDTIKGVLYSKDLLPYIGTADASFRWQDLLRAPYFVPESRMIDDLMEDFRDRKIHIAIVVDEFGGTQGIVTLEDIMEEIVGDIDDEYDQDEKLYKRIDKNTYIFEGKTPLSDFCRITGVDEKEFGEVEEVETLAGLILTIKCDFPKEMENFRLGRIRFLVLGVEKHRITSVRVHVAPQASETEKS